MKFSIKLPIAIKIYSLAATILVILMGVAVSNCNYSGLKK